MNAQNRISRMFIRVARLSRIAAGTSLNLLFIKTTSAASMATSVPAPIAIPISALVSAGPDNQIILGFYEDMQKSYFDQEAHRTALEKAVSEHIDKQVRITTRLLENRRSEEGLFINPNKIHLENVEFIDEDQF